MKIDTHQHFWIFDPIRDNWIDESMGIIRRDFMPSDLKPVMENNGFDGCVAIQADQSEEETTFLLSCATKNDFVKGVVGWLDLCSENIEERLNHFSKNHLFKGLRHIVQEERVDFLLRKDFQNGISKLEKYGLTYDLLIQPHQLKNAMVLADKFPNQKFIIDHLAKPEIRTGRIRDWKVAIEQIAKAPNVFCKISGMVTEADFIKWKLSDFTPYLDVIFKNFDFNRIMFGSDWPVCLLAVQYGEVINIVNEYIFHFSEEVKAKILGGNALKVYNL